MNVRLKIKMGWFQDFIPEINELQNNKCILFICTTLYIPLCKALINPIFLVQTFAEIFNKNPDFSLVQIKIVIGQLPDRKHQKYIEVNKKIKKAKPRNILVFL